MTIALAGRAAEQIVFGRVTNGAANDLEKVTAIARAMVFEWGMSDAVSSRTLRGDDHELSEETKQLRDAEQTALTERSYADAVRLLSKHRALLDRVAAALLEKETLTRAELLAIFGDVRPESSHTETVGTVQVLPATPAEL
jgi:cell division protease FtsH